MALSAVLLTGISEFKKPVFYGMGGVLLLFLIPNLFHLHAVSSENWGASGAKFSLSYMFSPPGYNLKANGLFYLNNKGFPVLFTLLAVWGAIAASGWKKKIVIGLWFLLFWGVFIVFYAGSYTYGADNRFSLVSYMPLAIFSGLGVGWIHQKLKKISSNRWVTAIPAVIIVFVFTAFLPLIRASGEEAWAARADHLYAQKFADLVPTNSLILTHNPNLFMLWGKNAAQASLLTTDPAFLDNSLAQFSGGVYFHFNFWCNVDDPLQKQFCQNILDNFQTELIKEYRERDYRFALYKVLGRR